MRFLAVLALALGVVNAQPPSAYGDDYYDDGQNQGGYSDQPPGGYGGDQNYEQEYAQDSLYHDYAARLEQKAAGCVTTTTGGRWLACWLVVVDRPPPPSCTAGSIILTSLARRLSAVVPSVTQLVV
jgi:hypothetical protein